METMKSDKKSETGDVGRFDNSVFLNTEVNVFPLYDFMLQECPD